jgi:hypothetical protein
LAERAALPVVARQAMYVADVVKQGGLSRFFAYRPVQPESLLGVGECVGGAALPHGHAAEKQVGFGLAVGVCYSLVQFKAFPEIGAGLIVIANSGVRVCQESAGFDLRDRVTEACRGCHGDALDREFPFPVGAPIEVIRHRPRDLPGVDIESRAGSQVDGGDQDRLLGLEPGHGLLVAGQPLGLDSGSR